MAFVDLSAEAGGAHPGSLDEIFTVYSIVNTLTDNLPAIAAVQLLVDGRQVDTLAGHVDVRRPVAKDLRWTELPQVRSRRWRPRRRQPLLRRRGKWLETRGGFVYDALLPDVQSAWPMRIAVAFADGAGALAQLHGAITQRSSKFVAKRTENLTTEN